MSVHSIILNPLSGGGNAYKRLGELEALLRERGIDYRVDITESSGDARRLAQKAVDDGLDGVIAVGGDGTFSEVVNGIRESGLEMLFAPCGTGNDFMRMFKLPKDMIKAVEVQLDSAKRKIDIGRCNDRYFLNVTGCGFDVDVLRVAEKYKGKTSAIGAYLRGAYSAIKNYRPMNVKIAFDDGEEKEMLATVISVGNGSYIGGGMKAVPGATVDDGLFDAMIAGRVNKLSIYVLLLLFAMGKHTVFRKLVTTLRCKSVHIKSKDLYIEADGEVFPCDDALLTIVPHALNTRLPV